MNGLFLVGNTVLDKVFSDKLDNNGSLNDDDFPSEFPAIPGPDPPEFPLPPFFPWCICELLDTEPRWSNNNNVPIRLV